MQSKKRSFIESIVNILIGFLIGLTIQWSYCVVFQISVTLVEHFGLSVCMTVASILRSYCVRRWFTKGD